jgi:hypothetical protein
MSVGGGSGSIVSALDGTAGNYKLHLFRSGGVDRWYCGVQSAAETGSNAGAPFAITALSDAGAQIDIPVQITRAAGGSIFLGRPVKAQDTTASTSTSSGALVVSGGVGVAGAIYAGGDVVSTGSGAQEIVCESTTGANYAGVISKNNSGNTFNLYSLGSTYGGTVFGGVSGSNQAVLEGSASISSICISHANPTGKIIIAPNRTNALMVENSLVTVASGVDLKLGNAYAAGAPTATGYIVIKDSTGTSYKIPAVAL